MLTVKPGRLFPAINQPSVYCPSLVAMSKESFCQPDTNESGNQSRPLKELKLGCISFQKEFLLFVIKVLQRLYYYMRNFCNLIGLEQWYFSLI